MKKRVAQLLIRDGYSETIAWALVDGYWERAECHGKLTALAVYKFILKELGK